MGNLSFLEVLQNEDRRLQSNVDLGRKDVVQLEEQKLAIRSLLHLYRPGIRDLGAQPEAEQFSLPGVQVNLVPSVFGMVVQVLNNEGREMFESEIADMIERDFGFRPANLSTVLESSSRGRGDLYRTDDNRYGRGVFGKAAVQG